MSSFSVFDSRGGELERLKASQDQTIINTKINFQKFQVVFNGGEFNSKKGRKWVVELEGGLSPQCHIKGHVYKLQGQDKYPLDLQVISFTII